MTAVGADERRTCTCATYRVDEASGSAPTPSAPLRVTSYDPAFRDERGEEFAVVTEHHFDGTPCRRIGE